MDRKGKGKGSDPMNHGVPACEDGTARRAVIGMHSLYLFWVPAGESKKRVVCQEGYVHRQVVAKEVASPPTQSVFWRDDLYIALDPSGGCDRYDLRYIPPDMNAPWREQSCGVLVCYGLDETSGILCYKELVEGRWAKNEEVDD
jgi:hypothetical protein